MTFLHKVCARIAISIYFQVFDQNLSVCRTRLTVSQQFTLQNPLDSRFANRGNKHNVGDNKLSYRENKVHTRETRPLSRKGAADAGIREAFFHYQSRKIVHKSLSVRGRFVQTNELFTR